MAASYFEAKMHEEAAFSLLIRKYPLDGSYLVAAGLEEALNDLASRRFTEDELAYLESTRPFKNPFLDYLKTVRFFNRKPGTNILWA
jgi:nicotinate phosphoribosyltransferase